TPVFWIETTPFLLLSALHALAATLYLAGVYAWARRLRPEAGVMVALLSLGQVTALVLFRRALSEAVFMPLLIWTVNAFDASLVESSTSRRWLLAGVVLLALLALVRPAGILVAGGFALALGVRAWQGQVSWRRACWLGIAANLPAL